MVRVVSHPAVNVFGGLSVAFQHAAIDLVDLDREIYGSIYGSFGAHERRYLSVELKPLLETLGGVAADLGGGSATAMAFTRRMEEVQTCLRVYCRSVNVLSVIWFVFVVLLFLRIRIFTHRPY